MRVVDRQFVVLLMSFFTGLSALLFVPSTLAAEEQSAPAVDKDALVKVPPVPPVPASPVKAARPPAAPMQQIEIKGSVQSYDERRNDTATKIVVTQEEILKNGDTTIAEVLKRLPGVTIGGVQGRGGEVRMRGLGSGYTQIMLNGEPSPPGFSLDSLAPDLIERIEIMRAATAEYSTQAVAGAINIILKKAIQSGQREIKFGMQDDNHHIGGSLNLQMSDRKGPLSYSLAAGLIHARYERLPTQVVETAYDTLNHQTLLRTTAQNSQGTFDSVNLAPRLNLSLGQGETISSQSFINFNRFSGNNSDRTTTSFGMPPPFAGNDYTVRSAFSMGRTDLTWTRKLDGGAKLDAKFGLNYNQRENTVAQNLLDPKALLIMKRDVDSSAYDKGISGSGKFSTPYTQDHALVFGWDGGISNRNEDRVQHDMSPVGLKESNSNQIYDASVKRLAVFTQDEWNITPRWSVYLGLRWEGLDTTSEGNSYASVKNTSSVWSPLFQTLWKLPDTKNDQLRFGLTRTYKAPTTNSLIPRRFTSNNNSITSPDTQGNPLLKPELAWGLDLSYEHFLPDGGLLSAASFVRRIEDITRRTLTQMDGLWISMPINDGVATTRGIELEAKLPLRSLIKSAPAIEVRANLSRNWSTISTVPGPNNRIDQQTPFSGNLGLDYKLDKHPLTAGVNYSFQNGGPVRISANQSTYTVPKRSLDMYTLWKFDLKTQLRLSLANALHQDNVTENTYTDNNGIARSLTTIPTTLQARANLEVKF